MAPLVALLLGLAAATAAESECSWESSVDGGQIRVLCRPRAIDAAFTVGGKSATLPESSVTSLVTRCRSADVESYLSNGTFSGLTGLAELTVERCRIATLPAVLDQLRQLRSLSLRTFNDDVHMVVEGGALGELQALQHLDLSHNRLWTLPGALLCPLQNLRSLNLSHNHIQDAEGLGLHGAGDPISLSGPLECRLPEVTSLDLSHNRVPTVGTAMLEPFPALLRLSLRHSRVELLEDGALDSVPSLGQLDLSGNELVSLPHDLFLRTTTLSKIRLANNSLSALTPGLFSGLSQLQLLDLSGNQLTSTWINSQTFSGLVRLVVLDVSANRLNQIDQSMFSDLYSLQMLKLQDNQIDAISANTFAALSNLHTLALSRNNLHRIDTLSLNGLHMLSSLSMDGNIIDTVRKGAFKNTTNLRNLKLNENRLTRVPEAFEDLHLLETLDLGSNYASSVEDKRFFGMNQLQSLHMQGNMLTNVTSKMLSSLPQLKVLNLANNLISAVQFEAFESNAALEAIRLDGNQLTNISGLFRGLSRLRWLNMSNNQIDTFDYGMLPNGIQWLDLHQNKIRQLGNYDDVASQMSITTLDASFNRLTSLSGKSLPNSVELLVLNDNLITHVEQYTFFLMTNLSRVDLFANQITKLELNALRLNMPNGTNVMPEVYVGGNPFICDCGMEWLQRYDQIENLYQYPRIMDLESIYCRLTYSRERAFVPLVDADTSMFLCPYQTHCFTTCHCCDFDACDCEMTCPNKCDCYHDQSWSSNIIDCTNNGFEEIPDRLPMDATQVYLDGNVFRNLSSLTFLGRKNMQVLYLNGSHIEVIHNETFAGLPSLTVLHLESNVITELHGQEFVGLNHLRELHLQDNRLRQVADVTFVPLIQLEVLRLDGNQLAMFSAWELQRNPYLVEIGLVGNPWSCECNFVSQLRGWLATNVRKVDDVSALVCFFGGRDSGVPVHAENGTCYTRQTEPTGRTMSASEYAVIVVSALAMVTLLVCLLVLVSVYRTELRVWIHSRCGVRVCYRSALDEPHERLFDAFVSYSDRDRSFVHHVLVPKLERSEPPYRLALHDRDFPHSAYLADTIVEAVESSRRTIMVLSKNFVENEWCRFQFKSAHHEVLKDRQKRLIVVMLGDVTHRELDPDLRLCLKANMCISWEDKRFWEKLRFALPDVKNNHRVLNSVSHYSEIDESVCYRRTPDTMESVWG
ncbi:toll-like receptor Tollo [Pollicipes pollicipes]|uniref:toll-like receptor Tollo n=1 Tax=Pollicipes pollicipes TaxID=41117 RepID=UPI001884EA9C|nr:toll-like receptor Tollo [Pollicipes pollicipes]